MLRAPQRAPVREGEIGAWLRNLPAWGRGVWAKVPRPVVVVASALFALAFGFVLAAGPIVRHRIRKAAERRHLEVTVGSVGVRFFAIELGDVRVRAPTVPGVELRLDRVRVELSAGLSPRSVEAKGGAVVVEGERDPEELARQLRELRGASSDAGSGSSTAAAIRLRVEDLALGWKLPSGEEIAATRIHAARDEAGTRLGCGSCSARYHHLALEATAADVELDRDGAPKRVSAANIVVSYAPPARAETGPPSTASAKAELAPPPLPVAPPKKGSRPVRAPATPPSATSDGPILPLPDLHALRSKIRAAVELVAPRIPDGGSVEIGGLSAKLDVGGEPLAFGPGAFTLTRRGDRVHLAFASLEKDERPKTGGTPLSLEADVPIGRGDVSAHLAGGPVSLAVLGVKEGTKGLTDVAKGTLEGKGQLVLADGGDALTFDGGVSLRSLSLKQPRIALDLVRGIDFGISARGIVDDKGTLRVDDAELDMGALHLKAHGTFEETTDHYALGLALDVAPAACQSLLDSTPEGLLPTVRPSRMAGVFGASMSLAFDTRTIDKLSLDYRIDDGCRMLEVPRDLSRDRFAGAFTYRTYHPDGTLGETTTGPGTPSWTDLDDISPFMVAAVLTTEDGAFYRHHGFNHAAIRSSVQANLKAGRFVRGASTITMQLAKNVFLSRDKALSRKIEEVILTDYLEQILQKDEMMELYLNVVEFGPDVYGITQAAEYYFGRKPEELDLAECFFLATLLPSPIRFAKLRDKGEVSEAWMHHLGALMEIAARNGKITRAELDEGLKEPIVFHRPGDPRPEPRKPVTSTKRDRDPYEEEASWRPLN